MNRQHASCLPEEVQEGARRSPYENKAAALSSRAALFYNLFKTAAACTEREQASTLKRV
jgi:hypothetical protein